MFRLASGVLLAFFSHVAVSAPKTGYLDLPFGGGDGVVFPAFDLVADGADESRAMAEASNGGLLLAGLVETEVTESSPCLGLVRLTRDGKPDLAFQNNTASGICHHNFLDDIIEGNYQPNPDFDMVAAPNGDIYVAGTVLLTQASFAKTFVCRFLGNGIKQGCVVLDTQGVGLLQSSEPSLLLRGQQVLVVTNPAGGLPPVLYRLAEDDLSIETQHQILGDGLGATNVFTWDADLTASGDLAIAGEARFAPGDVDIFVARYDLGANVPDTAFDGDGFKRIGYNAIANGKDSGRAVRALANGDILVAGRVAFAGTAATIGISRLDASGDAVESFNNGEPLTVFGDSGANIEPWAIDETSGGKIVLAGMYQYPAMPVDPFALRLLPGGELDDGFGSGGQALLPLQDDAVAYGMVLQDERIVLGGTIDQGFGDLNFLALRISDGRLFNDGFEPAQ